MDKFSKEKRGYIMSRIKGKDTSIEITVRRHLRSLGFKGYRIHTSKVLGNPDIIFRRQKVAIFLDGDFWHGYVLREREGKLPEYWLNKIRKNMLRDKEYSKRLKEEGWKVIRLWEHEVTRNTEKAMAKIVRLLE